MPYNHHDVSRHSARESLPPIDERLVMPGSGAEILEGRVLIVPGADPPHASRHLTLAYLLGAHTAPGFIAAIDMLTRTSARSDFAPDASLYPATPDPETGGRRLELVAFEIVSRQRLAVSARKARELSRRGVPLIVALVLARDRALIWESRVERFRPLHPDEVLESPALVPPLAVRSLLDVARTDEVVLGALERRRPDLVARIEERGEQRGEQRATRAAEHEVRSAIRDACTKTEIAIGAARAARLDRAGHAELLAILASILRSSRWPR